MRSYCAIYVDAGYLYAAAATRVTGTSLRSGVRVDSHELIARLIAQAEEDSGLPLLRVNWYDSGGRPGGLPDIHQDEIGLMPKVKLRLGRRSFNGEQKGVDLRIGLDLATSGRNRVVDVLYLVSGDDDLTEAVEEAQSHGVQVSVLAVPGQNHKPINVARHLRREADGVVLIDEETIDRTVRPARIPEALIPSEEAAREETPSVESGGPEGTREAPAPVPARATPRPGPRPGPATPAAPPSEGGAAGPHEDDAAAAAAVTPSVLAGRKPTAVIPPRVVPPRVLWSSETGAPGHGLDLEEATPELIDEVVKRVVDSWCQTATPAAVFELRKGKPFIPADLDRTLLVDLASQLSSYEIDDASRYALRDRFWDHVDRIRLS